MQNLPQQFQTPLSQKQKTFSRFFIAFLKCALNLEHFYKKIWVSRPNYFRNYWFLKTWGLKRLRALASEHHLVMNVLTGSKQSWNEHGTPLILFPRQFEVNWVGKSHMQNFPQHFQRPLSHKQKNFFALLIELPKCAWNFQHFQKKDEYPSLNISEILDSERRGYLNV